MQPLFWGAVIECRPVRYTIFFSPMLRAFFASREWAIWAYAGGALLIFSTWLQVQFIVALNSWRGGFYNLLQVADDYKDNSEEGVTLFYDKLISFEYLLSGFQTGEWSFAVLAMPYVIIATLTGWFTRIYALRWRQALTFNYIPRWRAVAEEIEGASQRIQEGLLPGLHALLNRSGWSSWRPCSSSSPSSPSSGY